MISSTIALRVVAVGLAGVEPVAPAGQVGARVGARDRVVAGRAQPAQVEALDERLLHHADRAAVGRVGDVIERAPVGDERVGEVGPGDVRRGRGDPHRLAGRARPRDEAAVQHHLAVLERRRAPSTCRRRRSRRSRRSAAGRPGRRPRRRAGRRTPARRGPRSGCRSAARSRRRTPGRRLPARPGSRRTRGSRGWSSRRWRSRGRASAPCRRGRSCLRRSRGTSSPAGSCRRGRRRARAGRRR